ncbi:hypothetical protein [Sphingomonas sp. R86521]|uniref:hypothetical protein n=1 Tax=Sphingomonas sp. R86521 TaxID=3093860 RepID=UPI0036D42B5F
MDLVQRLAIAAIINGLRKSGAIDDAAVAAIADELQAVGKITDGWGHVRQAETLRSLADDIAAGKSGE